MYKVSKEFIQRFPKYEKSVKLCIHACSITSQHVVHSMVLHRDTIPPRGQSVAIIHCTQCLDLFLFWIYENCSKIVLRSSRVWARHFSFTSQVSKRGTFPPIFLHYSSFLICYSGWAACTRKSWLCHSLDKNILRVSEKVGPDKWSALQQILF